MNKDNNVTLLQALHIDNLQYQINNLEKEEEIKELQRTNLRLNNASIIIKALLFLAGAIVGFINKMKRKKLRKL